LTGDSWQLQSAARNRDNAVTRRAHFLLIVRIRHSEGAKAGEQRLSYPSSHSLHSRLGVAALRRGTRWTYLSPSQSEHPSEAAAAGGGAGEGVGGSADWRHLGCAYVAAGRPRSGRQPWSWWWVRCRTPGKTSWSSLFRSPPQAVATSAARQSGGVDCSGLTPGVAQHGSPAPLPPWLPGVRTDWWAAVCSGLPPPPRPVPPRLSPPIARPPTLPHLAHRPTCLPVPGDALRQLPPAQPGRCPASPQLHHRPCHSGNPTCPRLLDLEGLLGLRLRPPPTPLLPIGATVAAARCSSKTAVASAAMHQMHICTATPLSRNCENPLILVPNHVVVCLRYCLLILAYSLHSPLP